MTEFSTQDALHCSQFYILLAYISYLSWLKNIITNSTASNMFNISVSVCQESVHGLVESSARLQSRCQLGLGSHLRLDRRRIHFQVHIVAGRIQFLTGSQTRVSVSCWLSARAVFSSLPCGPLHRAAHNMETFFFKSSKRESLLERQVAILCNGIHGCDIPSPLLFYWIGVIHSLWQCSMEAL